ncbi:hypothetical protein B0H13DRAFT_1716163 [Mycena leptocephala]|nr:hypothetical protein B0H13DRAFT_1716163 [Mycena leptocephala]
MASPFAPQLGTNYCPTDDEVAEIKAFLIEPALRLKQLDDEISDLQRAIDKLRAERESLVADVKAHRALISPVRRLPLDIIQEIFVACLPTQRNCVMSASEPPILLGRICSFWRAISLSTPRLWTCLHVVEPTRSPPDSNMTALFEKRHTQRLETMKDWLDRSGNCPLSISLEGALYFGGVDPCLFLQALIPFASRWRTINFAAQAPRLTEALSHLTESDMPILQDLAIYERPVHTGPVLSPPVNSWASTGIIRCPRLSKLSLSAEIFSPTELPLRWSQLTSLSLHDLAWESSIPLTTDRALQMLSQCPLLRTCSLSIHDTDNLDGEIPGARRMVECPLLHAMHLECRSVPAFTFPRMFRHLSLPRLRQFGLRGISSPESYPLLSFSSFLAVSTRLESLNISTDTFSKASLAELFRGLPPTMQRLKILESWAPSGIDNSFDDDILAILTPSQDSDRPSPCCPALQELTIRQCITVSDTALLRLITARMTAVSCSPLQRVEVTFSRSREFDILPTLQPFIDSGLLISLKYFASTPLQLSPWLGLRPFEGGPFPDDEPWEAS